MTDISLIIDQFEKEYCIDDYIRMDKILQLERELMIRIHDRIQVELRADEEEEELKYYSKMYEEDQPNYYSSYWF